MARQLGLEEVREAPAGGQRCCQGPGGTYSEGSSALALDGDPSVTLRFRLIGTDPEGLEALRHARRSLLREERILGRDAGEPSLEDALFSAAEIVWVIRPGERESCLRRLEQLLERANRVLSEMRSAASGLPLAGAIS